MWPNVSWHYGKSSGVSLIEVIYVLIGIKISKIVTSVAAIAEIHFQETQRSGAKVLQNSYAT